ncbi:MAG TPA: 4-hydroxy-tetrahydrodipicolinate reductase, partial [Rhodocyclaceae bacterium]|nr:4-hydroxy-tetrahydrodipicolinate reductase [Rhodocyclaceae bacterium]
MGGLRLGIVGASGRMGRMLIEAILKDGEVRLGAAIDQPGSPVVGKNAGELVGMHSDVLVTDQLDAGLDACDCLIDFTRPEGTLKHLELCRRKGVALIIGTTGFDDAGKAAIAAAAREIPVVFAPNMAVGVNLVFKLLDTAARILSEGYDIEVVEAHHRMKVDAPSGTALRMGEVIADALGRDLKECAVY